MAETGIERNYPHALEDRFYKSKFRINYIQIGDNAVPGDIRYSLNGRPRECIALVRQGMSSKEIARKLGISHRTVEQHVASALETLGVRTRLEAVALLSKHESIEESAQPAPIVDDKLGQPFMLRPAGKMDRRDDLRIPEGEVEYTRIHLDDGRSARSLFPSLGGAENTAPSRERHNWIVRISSLTILALMLVFMSIPVVLNLVKALMR